ncbi:MAG: hypothetical protein ACP5OA_00780 [Candidatus Woesearchaeota archaeon]
MTDVTEYFKKRKIALILTILVMLLGSALYIGTGAYKKGAMAPTPVIDSASLDLLRNVQLKTAYTPDGLIKIFALTKEDYISKLRVAEGDAILPDGGLLLGKLESDMMREEILFTSVGDELDGFFGVDIRVTGILDKTGSFIDDFHFVNEKTYYAIDGDVGRLFVKFKDAKTPKLFYLYDANNPSPAKIVLSEGDMREYYTHEIGKKSYHPLILGYDEAKMMREEKLFANTGDTIDNFFGRDIMIVGILQDTDTSLDMMHIVEPDFFEEPVVVVLV